MPVSSFLSCSMGSSRRPHRLVSISSAVLLLNIGCSGNNTSSTNSSPAVTVSGAPQTRIGATTQFASSVTGVSNSAVTWQVNGVNGGSSITGTISTTGLYTAPAALPSPNTVTIAAVSSAVSTRGC
jgi:hypothetical protein